MRLKSDTKKIMLNTAWMIFDKVFMLVLSLVVTVKIANYFGAAEYGTYQYVINIIAVLELLVTFVDGRVIKKKYIDNDAGLVVYCATICRVLFSGISVFIGILFLICSRPNSKFVIMFVALLANMVLSNLRFGMANRFEYMLKSRKTVLAADLSSLLGSGLQLGAIYLNFSIVAVSIITVITSLVSLIIIAIQYKIEFQDVIIRRKHIDMRIIMETVKESMPLAVAASCAIIYTRCDSIMIGTMLTVAEVGVYSVSVKLINIVQIALVPIRESVYPQLIHLYSTDRKTYERRYVQVTSLMTWIYIIGVLISFIILPYVFMLFKQEYIGALSVYRVHVIGVFFMYNSGLRAGHLTLIGRGDILMYSQFISVVANIILNIIGIKILGMSGAALTTVITQAMSLTFSNLLFKKVGRDIFMWQIKALNPMHIIKYVQEAKAQD